jgi:hypothetical protein
MVIVPGSSAMETVMVPAVVGNYRFTQLQQRDRAIDRAAASATVQQTMLG